MRPLTYFAAALAVTLALAACDGGTAPPPEYDRVDVRVSSECAELPAGVTYYTYVEDRVNCAAGGALRRATLAGTFAIRGELSPIAAGQFTYHLTVDATTGRDIAVAVDHGAQTGLSLTTDEYMGATLVRAADGRILLTQFRDPINRDWDEEPLSVETFVVEGTTLTRLSSAPLGTGPPLYGQYGAYSAERNVTAVIYLVDNDQRRRIMEIDHDAGTVRSIQLPGDFRARAIAYLGPDLFALDHDLGRVVRVTDSGPVSVLDLGPSSESMLIRDLIPDPERDRILVPDLDEDKTGTDLIAIYPDGRTERLPAFGFPARALVASPDLICARLRGRPRFFTDAPYEPEVFEAVDLATLRVVSRDTVRLDTSMFRESRFGCF